MPLSNWGIKRAKKFQRILQLIQGRILKGLGSGWEGLGEEEGDGAVRWGAKYREGRTKGIHMAEVVRLGCVGSLVDAGKDWIECVWVLMPA